MEAGLISVGGSYKSEDWEASAKLGMHAWNLTYLHKSSKVSYTMGQVARYYYKNIEHLNINTVIQAIFVRI